ncbi:hypothetical protein [Gemella massiliensis]|uniref:hypothetical protein n=1 Tax=Gemella massiliensis TaxID=1909670 RepID=UPI000931F248|nr:hypothetical protein [Gemella massiliensis]
MNDLLKKLKDRLHILHGDEDEQLKQLLSSSIFSLKIQCGNFDVETNLLAQELVFERVRYAYNDSLEYFDKNFRTQIINLALTLGET